MLKPNFGQVMPSKEATASDLHQILGDIGDSTVLTILALHPTVAQLEEARVWLNEGDDAFGKSHHPLEGVVAQIFDMLKVDDEEPAATKNQP
jgi:hypothetical protein